MLLSLPLILHTNVHTCWGLSHPGHSGGYQGLCVCVSVWVRVCVCVCVYVFTGCLERIDRETTLHAPGTTEAHMAPVSFSVSYINPGRTTHTHTHAHTHTHPHTYSIAHLNIFTFRMPIVNFNFPYNNVLQCSWCYHLNDFSLVENRGLVLFQHVHIKIHSFQTMLNFSNTLLIQLS